MSASNPSVPSPTPSGADTGGDVLHAVFEQSPLATALLDRNGRLIHANARYLEVTGYSPEELSVNAPGLLATDSGSGSGDSALHAAFLRGEAWSGELQNRRKDGTLYWEKATLSPIRNSQNRIDYFIRISEDITAQKTVEAERDRLLELHRDLALHDSLTNLYNRRGFDQELRRIWSLSQRHAFPIGLMVIDIDHFKTLNDSYGHTVGDQVLKECSDLIRQHVRESDIVSRYGGDEFVVILPWAEGHMVREVAERLLTAFRECTMVKDSHELKVTLSIGIASIAPGQEVTLDQFLTQADQALYRSKQNGRNRVSSLQDLKDPALSRSARGTKGLSADDSGCRGVVLVVDDDPAIRDLLSDLLRRKNFSVHTAETSRQALDLLKEEAGLIDVALIDLQLGRESGLDLLKQIRQLDHTVIGVIITGMVTVDSAVESLRHGAYDFVQKPIAAAHLLPVLERASKYRDLVLENQRYQHHLSDMVREKSAALSQALDKVRQSYRFTLEAMAGMLDARERNTGEHSKRVSRISRLLAEEMGIDPDQIEPIETGALLHDIGKIAIPDAILLKPGPLTQDEQTVMRMHPQLGYDIICSSPLLKEASELVLSHQERYDGNGYPRGLKGKDICLGARIFAVVDAYDVMRSERPYSPPRSPDEAMQELLRHKGTQFDPGVVDAFERCHKKIEEMGQWT